MTDTQYIEKQLSKTLKNLHKASIQLQNLMGKTKPAKRKRGRPKKVLND